MGGSRNTEDATSVDANLMNALSGTSRRSAACFTAAYAAGLNGTVTFFFSSATVPYSLKGFGYLFLEAPDFRLSRLAMPRKEESIRRLSAKPWVTSR